MSDRRCVDDGAVWGANLLIIRAPLLHFYPGAVKGQAPVLIEALGVELSVYAGPQIKLMGNEPTAWACW